MFERFSDQARNVVVLAQEESRRLGHSYIGTEHILLGLIRESEGTGAKALASMRVGLDAARQKVEDIIGRGNEAAAGHIPFTPRSKRVLEFSLRESLELGHDYIGTEHILLGLIREDTGVAAQVLRDLGASLTEARARVLDLATKGPPETGIPSPRFHQATQSVQLGDVLRRLDALAGRLDEVIGRLIEIERHLRGPGEQEHPAS